ncbi:MAG: DUF1905 domain-containing protein [Sphingobacteriales bacterium]|nr:MAG: DUF1905 domain-containing protein [Sphingobacteriales bacterium]
MSKKPLVRGEYKLQRFQAKGGWTFIAIPEILQQNKWKTGGIKIKGSIDNCVIGQLRLMRTDNMVFLPINAGIRKQIKKQEGDTVGVLLQEDESDLIIPDEITVCLLDEPAAHKYFKQLTEGYKREYIQWINAAMQPATKAGRIAKMIEKLLKKQTLSKIYDQ